MADVERREVPRIQEQGVEEIPEEIPETVERIEGVKRVLSRYNKSVVGDDGKPLTQTPQTQQITITIPASDAILADKAKGSTDNAGTWLAKFFQRLIKKALHLGWRVMRMNRES